MSENYQQGNNPQQAGYQQQAPQGAGQGSYGQPQKSRLVAGLLGIILGAWGIHNFYLGFNSRGVLQLVLTIVTFGVAALWGFIEGILYLVKTDDPAWSYDANGVPLAS